MIYYEGKEGMVRTSNELDIDLMKNRLRRSDIDEVWASHHHTPEEALRLSFEMSTLCLTVDIKGMPVAMFGIAPQTLLSDRANVWFLATDGILKVRKSFVKQCRKFIDVMLKEYPILENYVDARNKLSIRWLKWCGAEIEEAKPIGAEKLPFHHFSFRRNN